jgi:trigger factor
MEYITKKLIGSEVELTVTVKAEEYKKNMEDAAKRLSERAGIKGFRPGKAPYDMVKSQLGEQKILEEALESIIQKNYYDAVTKEKLSAIGMPLVTLEKVAAGNDLVFKAKVALMPTVKLPNLEEIKVKQDDAKVEDKEVDETVDGLRRMQMKEVIKNGISTDKDKVVIDMDMLIDKVPVEGGFAKDHQVYLSEKHYIPGLSEQLIGLKKDEKKEFSLEFPKEHYQKHLAGKMVDFKITVKDVYTLELPPLDEEFAKSLGQKNIADLKELIKKNMEAEAVRKVAQKTEAEILEKIIAKSEFSEIPDLLIKNEKHKMFHELEHDLEHRGLSMEDYLKQLKKTEDEIFQDFTVAADKRIRAALVAKQIALDENIKAEQKDIDEEIKLIKQNYPDNPTVEENIKKPEVLDTIAATIQNRKVMEWLKEKVANKEKKKYNTLDHKPRYYYLNSYALRCTRIYCRGSA